MSKDKGAAEVREFCGWVELVHALVKDAGRVRPIIVGTRKAKCENIKVAWDVLRRKLAEQLGIECYNS